MMVAFDDDCVLSMCDFAMRWDDLILRVKLPRLGAEASSGQSCFRFCLIIIVFILLMAANDMQVMHCNRALRMVSCLHHPQWLLHGHSCAAASSPKQLW